MASTPDSPRRGLPRSPGGEPWPPAPAGADDPTSGPDLARAAGESPIPAPSSGVGHGDAGSVGSVAVHDEGAAASRPGAATVAPVETGEPGAPAVRRGLPRVPGGEPWPPARPDAARADAARPASARPDAAPADDGPPSTVGDATPGRTDGVDAVPSASEAASPGSPRPGDAPAAALPERGAPASAPATPAAAPDAARVAPRPPLTVPRSVWPGAAASAARRPKSEPRRIGGYTPVQWLGSAVVLGAAALVLACIVVVIARVWLSLGPGRDFVAAYPGEYALPAAAPVGLPAWLGWQHFLNGFFLLLIIRSGLQVRREKRPSAFWSPRRDKKRRISLALWFHQALDILWIANGVVFVVLLFVTGQWMRIVPTSWDVFPNALSAAAQYASLDWPTENGWVNYNSLQQLSYFAVTFVAAPLAIVTGVRLSGIWPKDAARLNRLYPAEWARRLHFPVMLFFVAFIVVHVGLVLATGALRNLNHMYAARGSTDPGAYADDPMGLLIFAASLLVMAGAWVAARPAVLVPIARLFGDVKQR